MLGLATGAAMWEASGHLDGPSTEVDLQVMFVEPGKAEDYALLTKLSDHQEDSF